MQFFHKKVITLLSIIGVMVILLASCAFTSKKIETQSVNQTVEQDKTSLQSALGLQNILRSISKSVSPAVVNIRGVQKASPRQFSNGNDPFADFFRKFFGDQAPNQRPQRDNQVMGSGFIISKDGYIITNAHVVNGTSSLEVQTSNQEIYKGHLIGLDEKTDIALVKIDPKKEAPLTVAPLGNSDEIEPGDLAIAIGNPFGLNGTFTFGAISAKGRNSFMEQNAPYKNYIQSDVTVNPGNSGGPLINIKGQVIGINSAIYSTSGGSIGISFAVPINIAKNVIEQLVNTGHVSRGSIGAIIQPLTEDIAKYNKLKDTSGIVINDVTKNGPADKAGVQPGDVVTQVNGKKIRDTSDFVSVISSMSPKTPITLTVVRAGKTIQVKAVLDNQNSNAPLKGESASSATQGASANSYKWAGLTLMEANAARNAGFNIPEDIKGIMIIEMDPQSKAAQSGIISAGDLIVALSKQPVNTLADLKKIISGGKSFLVQFKTPGAGNKFLVLP